MMPGSCREGKPEIDRGFGGLGGFSRIDLEKNPRKSAQIRRIRQIRGLLQLSFLFYLGSGAWFWGTQGSWRRTG
jgi:hypothetical protein